MSISENTVNRYGEYLAKDWEADINAWYIKDNCIEFELTRMNDKWWIDIPFEKIIKFDETNKYNNEGKDINSRNYTKEDIIKMLHEINNDCQDCLSMYIRGCLNKDEHMIFCAKESWFNKLTPIQQTISCLINFMEE